MGTAKIIVTGLDNAGKTSLLIALEKKFAYENDLKELKPTVRINRDSFTFLNQQIYRWDFGGQEKYREEYLIHKERFFSDVDIFFFVIDVQDRERFIESVEYFTEIVDFFAGREAKPPIMVLLHKYDPELKEDAVTEKAIISLKDMILKAKGECAVDFFETSIYEIDSVMRAFSQAFARYLPRAELISNVFEEFAAEHPSLAMMLLDCSGITVADYYKPQLTPDQRNSLREMRTLGLKSLLESGGDIRTFQSEMDPEHKVFGKIVPVTIENASLAILVLSDDDQALEADIGETLPRVEEILMDILKE
ncbi:MAG TPA: ADP-ribosylation factor-like protein [Candidatus Lokiarchaeia archaeon]|nr:ADP-ribosylation factor-like protein [Candidatus Lokiarchaeia archaeon]